MAVEVLKDFLARLGFEVDEAASAKFNASLATGTTRALAFGATIQAMAVGAYAAVYKMAEGKSQMLALADGLDMNVAKLEEWGFVAEQTGGTAEAFYSSLENLNNALGQAAIAQGPVETFHRLGIRIRNANGGLRDSVEVLMEVGEKIKDMNRAQATMFLGELGIDSSLIRMLTSDISGLRKTWQDMYQAVGVDSQKAAEDSRKFTGEVKMLFTLFKMLGDGISAIFVGQMGEDVVRFRKLIQENVSKIIPVLKTVIDVVLRIGKAFFVLTARLAGWIGDIIGWFGKLDSGTQNLILGITGFALAWRYLNLALLMTPIGGVIAGFIALLGLIDDYMVWKEGGDSLIDWGPWAEDIGAIVDALGVLFGALGQVWDVVKGPLFDTLKDWGKVFISVISSILKALASLVRTIVSLFKGDFSGALDGVVKMFESLFGILQTLYDYILKIFDGMGSAITDALGWAIGGMADMFGMGGDKQQAARPVLGPRPALEAAAANSAAVPSDTTLHSKTEINVYGNNPEATARRVASNQNRVNADLVRHAKGAAR